jgi:hypothetical protein
MKRRRKSKNDRREGNWKGRKQKGRNMGRRK